MLLLAALPLLPLEKEKESGTSLKRSKKHSKSPSSKRDKREKKKHKRKRSPSPSPSSSSSSVSSDSSSLQRSPARKRSRANSRSPSPAVDNPHSASRTVSPVSHSLHADNDDEFNSHSEDNQDSAPDVETQDVSEAQSNVSTEDMRFHNLVEEVFKLLPADMFPKKPEQVLGGNRPRSSIEMEMRKATKKSISLPQSRCPLINAVDCLKESLGAVEAEVPFQCPPQLLRTGGLLELILTS